MIDEKTVPIAKEYEILSGDRQSAIQIFVQAIVAASAILAVAFYLLLKSETFSQALATSLAGFALLGFFVSVIFRCRRHDQQLYSHLRELGARLGYMPVISTKYIFDITAIMAGLLTIGWIVVAAFKVTNPALWTKW